VLFEPTVSLAKLHGFTSADIFDTQLVLIKPKKKNMNIVLIKDIL
tara:strand:- start:155 stop:289 length:135 start_codon:yes stop_codon:yes gene_type:complete